MIETRRLPGSGAGPSPDRLLIGSEGILGIITEAWMRLQDRPQFRAGGAVRFPDFFTAASGVAGASRRPDFIRRTAASSTRRRRSTPAPPTAVWRSWCWPSNPAITRSTPWMARALECCADHGGRPERPTPPTPIAKARPAPGATPLSACPMRASAPSQRGIINDTFETAITWDRFECFHDKVKAATERAIREATGRPGQVTCRCTHVYPDGPAPYFTFHALGGMAS